MVDRAELIREAEQLVARGKLSLAIAKYRRLLTQQPDDISSLNRLGDLHARASRSDEAIRTFLDVAARYEQEGFFVKSIAICKKIIKLDPARLDVYERLGSLYAKQGLLPEATRQYSVLQDYYSKQDRNADVARIQRQLDAVSAQQTTGVHHSETPTGHLPIEGVAPVRTRSDLMVFLCHASEDKEAVRRLYAQLKADLLQPWLDEEDLLPGQRWEYEIQRAVRKSHVVLVCLSTRAVAKSGFVHKEIRLALDVLEEQPEGVIFVVPVRLEECPLPQSLSPLHYVNLYAPGGYDRLMRAIHERARQLGFMGGPDA